MGRYKRYTVEWVDSHFYAGWREPWEASKNELRCETTGYLVAETKDALVFSLSIGQQYVSDQMAIPKCAILKKRLLK